MCIAVCSCEAVCVLCYKQQDAEMEFVSKEHGEGYRLMFSFPAAEKGCMKRAMAHLMKG